jgi:hypothetical protein
LVGSVSPPLPSAGARNDTQDRVSQRRTVEHKGSAGDATGLHGEEGALGHGRRNGDKVDTVDFPGGSFKIAHSNGTGTQHFDPKTCLMTISQHGTYKLLSGTGKYAGISGSGKYQFTALGIGARSGGKCVQSKPPVAWHQVINASGPVSLP